MKEGIFKEINIKKIGNISLIVSAVIIIYYTLSTYKTYLEIKDLKKNKV
jgi:hypothetical protein